MHSFRFRHSVARFGEYDKTRSPHEILEEVAFFGMFRCKVDEETELRLLEIPHAAELYALTDINRAQLREWLGWVDMTQAIPDTQRYIAYSLNGFAQNNGFVAGIWHQGRLVGTIGHTMPIDWLNRVTRLGYWLSLTVQGKGIMTRCCKVITEDAFQRLKLNKVEIRCSAENQKSRAVATRLGFKEECTMRCGQYVNGQYRDLVIYGMLADEWGKQG
jgi:ribosomal-protein-serine acetyltransferase